VKGRRFAASAAFTPKKNMEEPKWETSTAQRRVAWALAREREPTDHMVVSRVGHPPILIKSEFKDSQDGRLE